MPVGFVGPALQGASFISRFGIPLLQQAGIGAGIAGLGALANTASKAPSNAPRTDRRANVGRNSYSGVIGSIPPSANGESYRRAELRLGDAARAGGGGGGGGNAGYSFTSHVGQPGGSAPADRAYQQEKARVAQMTEQDPMFKKYKVAELTKAYNTASPEEKNKIGLQIWATTNPELAAKLKPGQSGYQEAYDLLGTQTFGTGQPVSTQVNFEQSAEQAGTPTPELPAGFAQAYTSPVPNFGMGVNMQQTAYSPEGQVAPEMVPSDFSNVPLMSVPKDLVDPMRRRLFKQAFESRIK